MLGIALQNYIKSEQLLLIEFVLTDVLSNVGGKVVHNVDSVDWIIPVAKIGGIILSITISPCSTGPDISITSSRILIVADEGISCGY